MNSHNDHGATPLRSAGFVVVEHWIERTVVISASGDLDMLTAPTLAAAIEAATQQEFGALIVDLTTVDFLASAGMTVLLDAHRNIVPPNRFGIVADGPATSRPMKLVGVDAIVAVYRTLDDAVGDLR
ncbi:MAG: STAS domain-containing protein [Mycobacterium sp.]